MVSVTIGATRITYFTGRDKRRSTCTEGAKVDASNVQKYF